MMSQTHSAGSEVIYALCLPSFKDGNGDGLGDLVGLNEKLDYLAWLGISAVWLTPFYKTDFFDFGYDVIDYAAVDERFGKLADLDRLVHNAHDRGIKIILDFVPN